MRLTIERMRTLVLIAAGLIVVAILAFLLVARLRNHSATRDLPARLGINVTEQADHVIYTQTHAGHTLFKIDAAKVVQISNGVATLSDVKIDLYGSEGNRVDLIEGHQFQYDQKAGIARAIGPVEIVMFKPGQSPAIAPKAALPANVADKTKISKDLAEAAHTAESEGIRVKTSGLVFDQASGVAETHEHLDFVLAQGSGSGDGALFDSQSGHMVLDRNVVMHITRTGGSIDLQAAHAEFERGSLVCTLRNASLAERKTTVQAGTAVILFREDGTAQNLDAAGTLTLHQTAGSTLTAPRGHLEFDQHNHPVSGLLEGGVVFDARSEVVSGGRKSERSMHGTAPAAQFTFTAQGDLSTAHLERAVDFTLNEKRDRGGAIERSSRHWKSPVADLAFQKNKAGGVLLKSLHGTGGTILTSETQTGTGPQLPATMLADDLTGLFSEDGALASLKGIGHASIDQTNAAGILQTASGDTLDAQFKSQPRQERRKASQTGSGANNSLSNLERAVLSGHVELTQTQPAAAGKPQAPVSATAGRAEYEGDGEWVHLTQSPRVVNGGVELTAVKIDLSRASGDAFAHGNVKATWAEGKSSAANAPAGLGGQTPSHVVSNEAVMHQADNEAVFTGNARLWQGNNSVAAPRITLNRSRQTLVAEGVNAVSAVFLSTGSKTSSAAAPQLMRFKGSLLKYSAAERKAWLNGAGNSSAVAAETGTGTISADSMEVILLPIGVSISGDSAAVDRVIARGHVRMDSQGRQGSGGQLVYTGENGQYTLTGPLDHLPTLFDPERGTVRGETLIFSSRDDSVKVEGQRTTTETTTQK